jgi:hypothetical protein
MLSLVPAFLFAPAAPAIFDQSIAAFKARKSFDVTIGLQASLAGQKTNDRFRLTYLAPSKVLLQNLVGNRPNLIYWLNGASFIAYDVSAREMVVRSAPSRGPIDTRFSNAMGGGLEDPVTAQLSPSSMQAFLGPFKSLGGWTTSRNGDRIELIRLGKNSGGKNLTRFAFSATSKLLTEATIDAAGSQLHWSFDYHSSPKSLSWAPPRGTKKVSALGMHVRIDTADARAKNVVDRCIRAYGRINSIAFSVSGSRGTSTNWMSGTSFRSKQTYLDWSYVGGVFTVKDIARKRSYRGKCKPSGVTTYLRILQRPMEPVLQGLLMKRNPVYGWFTSGTKISSKGAIMLGKVNADALELKSTEFEASLLVRRDNSLVASVNSRSLQNGSVVSSAGRDFTYWIVNKPLPAGTFEVKVTNPLPLSRIGK